MFFEDVNMLLPIETFHDEATNTVYTTTDRMGTYCLVDMEIFLDNLDKQLNVNEESEAEIEVQPEKSGAMSKNSNDADGYACCTVNKSDAKSKAEDDFDAVFMIDCRSVLSAGEYALIQKSIIEASDTIFIKSPNARVRIVIMNSIGGGSSYRVMKLSDIKSIEPSKDNSFFTNIDDVYSVLSKLPEMTEGGNDCNLTGALSNVCEYAKAVRRKTFCFCYFKAKDTVYQVANVDSYDILHDIKDNSRDINISAICDNNAKGIKYGYAIDMCNMTKGFFTDGYDNSSDYVLSHIYADDGNVENGYKAIIATGYKTVVLNNSLQENYDWYQNSSRYEPYRATDYDGLADFEEIMFTNKKGYSLIDDSDPSHVKMRSFYDILDIVGDKMFYVENGLERYKQVTGEDGKYPMSLLNVPVLPINSDPTSEDGDKDGISDYSEILLELAPLQSTVVEIDDSIIDDSDCIGNTKDIDEISFYDGFVYSEEVSKGGYSDDSEVFKKPALKFTRSGNSTFQFLIKPNENSDYVISYDGICDVIVERINARGIRKALSKDKIEDLSNKKMTLILNCGESYLITVNNNSSQSCTVRIYQDNWVYAPNGGIRTGRDYSDEGIVLNETYLTDEMVYRMIVEDLKNITEEPLPLSELQKKSKDEKYDLLITHNVASGIIRAIDKGNKEANSVISDIFTDVGNSASIAGVILMCLPQTSAMEIITGVVTVAGGTSVVAVTASNSYLNDLAEAAIYGDYNICMYSRTIDNKSIWAYNGFDPWNNQKYINKYYSYETYSRNGYPSGMNCVRCEISRKIINANQENNGKWTEIT